MLWVILACWASGLSWGAGRGGLREASSGVSAGVGVWVGDDAAGWGGGAALSGEPKANGSGTPARTYCCRSWSDGAWCGGGGGGGGGPILTPAAAAAAAAAHGNDEAAGRPNMAGFSASGGQNWSCWRCRPRGRPKSGRATDDASRGRYEGASLPSVFSRLRHLALRFWNQTCNNGKL